MLAPRPSISSGAMYRREPVRELSFSSSDSSVIPVSVMPCRASTVVSLSRPMPKSVSRAIGAPVGDFVMRMFEGLRSLCRTPTEWAAPMAVAIWAAISTRVAIGMAPGPPRDSAHSESVPPSVYSASRKKGGWSNCQSITRAMSVRPPSRLCRTRNRATSRLRPRRRSAWKQNLKICCDWVFECRASHTSPNPPSPSFSISVKLGLPGTSSPFAGRQPSVSSSPARTARRAFGESSGGASGAKPSIPTS